MYNLFSGACNLRRASLSGKKVVFVPERSPEARVVVIVRREVHGILPEMPNETVEKSLGNVREVKLGGNKTLPAVEIVDPGAFCEADFFRDSFLKFSGYLLLQPQRHR